MNIIIIGCGRFGSSLAQILAGSEHNISVVDRDGERLSALGNGFNGLKVRGIEFDDEILHEAGIESADVILPLTPDENLNITIALMAKEIYHVPRIIARLVNTNRQYIYDQMDVETINPIDLGVDMLRTALSLSKLNQLTAINQDYRIITITVAKTKGTAIKEIEKHYHCAVSGLIRHGIFSLIQTDQTVEIHDQLICTISRHDASQIIAEL